MSGPGAATCQTASDRRQCSRLVTGATPVKWGVHIYAKYAITWTYAYSAYFVDINAYFLHMFCISLQYILHVEVSVIIWHIMILCIFCL